MNYESIKKLFYRNRMKLHIIFLFFVATSIFDSQTNYVTRSETILEKQESQSKWFQKLLRTIKKDPKIYQIMLLSNYEKVDNSKIIQNLQENLPTMYFNDLDLKREMQHLGKRNSLRNPRDTTLFIVVESANKNNTHWLERMTTFIKNLSDVRIRPRCLIIRLLKSNQTSNYAKFLQKMWKDLFLDVTILDVVKDRATIHPMNPFFNYYKVKPLSKRTLLFPNKLENLNGYPLKIVFLNRPPYMTLKRNSTYHPVDISGPDAVVERIFAEMMNYRKELVPSKTEEFGTFSCNVNRLIGFDSSVQKGTIQFISVTTTLVRSICRKEIIENAIFALDHYVAVAPTLKSNDYSITVGETFYYSIVLTVLITIIGREVVEFFKFERSIWNWTVIVQVLFGVSVFIQPNKLKEQFFFRFLLLVHCYYSFHILESLTDFNFRMGKERELNNINDLMKSDLQFCSEINTRRIMPGIFNQANFTSWVKKGRVFALEECIEFLVEYKNVTCIMKLSQAEWFAGFYKEQNLVKFIPEFLASVGIGFFLEPGSPYVEKFQQVHRSLKEFGLLERSKISKTPNATRYLQLGIVPNEKLRNSDNSGNEWKIQSLLFGVMIAGYFSSILSFFVELFLGKRARIQSL